MTGLEDNVTNEGGMSVCLEFPTQRLTSKKQKLLFALSYKDKALERKILLKDEQLVFCILRDFHPEDQLSLGNLYLPPGQQPPWRWRHFCKIGIKGEDQTAEEAVLGQRSYSALLSLFVCLVRLL